MLWCAGHPKSSISTMSAQCETSRENKEWTTGSEVHPLSGDASECRWSERNSRFAPVKGERSDVLNYRIGNPEIMREWAFWWLWVNKRVHKACRVYLGSVMVAGSFGSEHSNPARLWSGCDAVGFRSVRLLVLHRSAGAALASLGTALRRSTELEPLGRLRRVAQIRPHCTLR